MPCVTIFVVEGREWPVWHGPAGDVADAVWARLGTARARGLAGAKLDRYDECEKPSLLPGSRRRVEAEIAYLLTPGADLRGVPARVLLAAELAEATAGDGDAHDIVEPGRVALIENSREREAAGFIPAGKLERKPDFKGRTPRGHLRDKLCEANTTATVIRWMYDDRRSRLYVHDQDAMEHRELLYKRGADGATTDDNDGDRATIARAGLAPEIREAVAAEIRKQHRERLERSISIDGDQI